MPKLLTPMRYLKTLKPAKPTTEAGKRQSKIIFREVAKVAETTLEATLVTFDSDKEEVPTSILKIYFHILDKKDKNDSKDKKKL